MSTRSPAGAYARFAPWRRLFEIGYWVCVFLANAIGNALTALIDTRRAGLGFAAWEPVVWEWSSALSWLSLVLPLVWASRRWPLQWENWRRRLPAYALASMLFSVAHVGLMVAVRMLVYGLHGRHYDPGSWLLMLGYEYLKDVRTLASMLLAVEGYRFLLRRWQGEAALLGAPDEGPPVEPIERPARFLVRKLGRDFLVAASDIEYVQAASNYVNLHVRGHDYPLRSTLAALETRLDPARFARIHRSYLVNVAGIVSIEPLDGGEARIHLADATVLPCSRRYLARLRQCVAPAPRPV